MDDTYYPDNFDEPYRTCEVCDISHHEEYGHSCDECDIWICNNCWPEHKHAAGCEPPP